MHKAKDGDTVQVHYTGKLEGGAVFDTSVQREPLQFTLGKSKVIRGVQEAVAGMAVGETKTVEVSPDKAYGMHREDLVFQVGRRAIPPTIEPKVGQRLEYRQPDGGPAVPLTVREVTDQTVTL
ncbi:MAG: FKBP-type peptidyl-prolyl cis-trans isomerase, partial [Gemmatimonadales bacterium]